MKKDVRVIYNVMKEMDYEVTIEDDNSVNEDDFEALYDIIQEQEENESECNTIVCIYDPDTGEAYYEE